MLIFLNNAARFQRLFSPNFRFDPHHIKFESIKIKQYNNMNPFDNGRYQDDKNIFKTTLPGSVEVAGVFGISVSKMNIIINSSALGVLNADVKIYCSIILLYLKIFSRMYVTEFNWW